MGKECNGKGMSGCRAHDIKDAFFQSESMDNFLKFLDNSHEMLNLVFSDKKKIGCCKLHLSLAL